MNPEVTRLAEIPRLSIASPNRLAQLLGIPAARLFEAAQYADTYYAPFDTLGRPRPFQRKPQKMRTIDNPRGELKKIQRRIYRKLLRPICFPTHILGGIPNRSVLDNANSHLSAHLLVTLDVRKCFPSINNVQVYETWHRVLGCSPPVARLLTRLTTFERRLPQGSPASPLLANLFMWSIDAPIRQACEQMRITYRTWIDDLTFSGERSREVIQTAASVLAARGLRLSHKKLKIMGPRQAKMVTGARLGKTRARAPKDKLAWLRSGIHKLRMGLVPPTQQQRHVEGLIGQLLYIEQLCPKDGLRCARDLVKTCRDIPLSRGAKSFLATRKTS